MTGRRAPSSRLRRAGRPGAESVGAVAATLLLAACASLGLGDIVQPPRIGEAPDRTARLRLLLPSADLPAGGAGVRLFARVENPNRFGIDLARVTGDLFLEGTRAAGVDFPLGVPLQALADTVVPLDLTVGFDDLAGLAQAAQRALGGGALQYRLEGTVTVDAGALGRPTFGPSTLLTGAVQVTR